MATTTETDAMRRAIALSARALGATAPNPVVGCVILDTAGTVVGEGWHRKAGGPHAEVHALRAAGAAARGGTAVVTLEPCNHTGRTGPCAQALIEAGVARVVHAVSDPSPAASGGAATLRAAGVDVEGGLLAAEAEAVNVAWLTSVRRGRPFVRWKYAATLDGRIAAADGSSRWISSAESRADVHRLRAEADAVVAGSGTLLADDPHLAVRGIPDAVQPLRVVVDSRARTPRGARVLDDAAPTLIAVSKDADTSHLPDDVEVVRIPYAPRRPAAPGTAEPAPPAPAEPAEPTAPVAAGSTEPTAPAAPGAARTTPPAAAEPAEPTAPGASQTAPPAPAEPVGSARAAAFRPEGVGLDVHTLLAELHARGIRSVLLEGGPTLAGAFVAAGAVDCVVGYLAPALLGAGASALGDAGISTIAQALRLDVTDVARFGPDLRVTAVPTAAQEK
ncbi:bifunctional diaminohydroxyphosphoribosylaminopyrimidine deaminase/5-amino-6-(5-phosphoribosylamino)uracil reductase RibD [Actinacidiphila bryophytorum]|uniref:bifunctional diaminohydroxyphosphoribosylaminopyrimidine deaminase/5-amino-6-(5-phosphoribosylamino)uracil reductase RibD n=1 Tax=Actinacidiphila bryophytorum TaxID=1436133 RepID=UPI0027DD83DE|nr:bifunctional diaminohydroxyphosphoribosylaminopyrimidine deaminase/5-amino-6-(5-phosphoribosylamino)uracil reductase RibD [Actinacidiphila bryophytorum]